MVKTALGRVYVKGHPAWGLGFLSPGFGRWTEDPWGPRCSESLLGIAIAIFRKGKTWVWVPSGLFRFSPYIEDLALSYWEHI